MKYLKALYFWMGIYLQAHGWHDNSYKQRYSLLLFDRIRASFIPNVKTNGGIRGYILLHLKLLEPFE